MYSALVFQWRQFVDASHVLQGTEPAHSAMLADYMRHNIGHLRKSQHSKPVEEPFEEVSQPDMETEVHDDDHAKAPSFHFWLLF